MIFWKRRHHSISFLRRYCVPGTGRGVKGRPATAEPPAIDSPAWPRYHRQRNNEIHPQEAEYSPGYKSIQNKGARRKQTPVSKGLAASCFSKAPAHNPAKTLLTTTWQILPIISPTLWIRARMLRHTPYAGSKQGRSTHMFNDTELTARDLYMYRRGEMREYIRNHGILDSEIHHMLYQWVVTGHSVHDNPWGIRDHKRGLPCDYLEAMETINRK